MDAVSSLQARRVLNLMTDADGNTGVDEWEVIDEKGGFPICRAGLEIEGGSFVLAGGRKDLENVDNELLTLKLTKIGAWHSATYFAGVFASIPASLQEYFTENGLGVSQAVRWSNIFDSDSDGYEFCVETWPRVPEGMQFIDFVDVVLLLASRAIAPASAEQARKMARDAVVRNGAFLAAMDAITLKTRSREERVQAPVQILAPKAAPWKTKRQRDLLAVQGDDADAANRRARIEERE